MDDEEIATKIPEKEELIGMMDEMIKTFERLPQYAMIQPVSHYDMLSLMILIRALFACKADLH